MKKHILLLVPMLHQGGFERVCVQTARLLQDTCHVTIGIFSDRDMHYDVTGLDVVNIHRDVKQGKALKALNVLARARDIGKLKKEKHIDLTYSFGESANLVNVLSKTHGKTVTGIRCSTDLLSPRLIKLFTAKSDRVIACSRAIEEELQAHYAPVNTVTLYNPVDTDAILAAASNIEADDGLLSQLAERKINGTKILCTMGRDDIIKGYWHLIKALFVLRQEGKDATLLIMGAGSFQRAKTLSAELGVSKHVIFAGNRTNPFPYVAASDLYVLSSNHEGFPNALLEAMSLKKAVVASDCKTGPKEILCDDAAGTDIREITVTPYGVLLPSLSGEENYDAFDIRTEDRMLSDAIARVLFDEDLCDVLSEASFVRALQFTKARYKESLHRILSDTIEEACV